MKRKYPVILTIAGSDASGGAGIQADIKAISALKGFAASAITAVTVQNTMGVTGIHPVPTEIIDGQIRAVMDDLEPEAIKIGMVNDPQIVEVIVSNIRKYKPAIIVYDPVMVSTSGCKLMTDSTIDVIKKKLIPLASLITPNLCEAEVLYGKPIPDFTTMKQAAKELSTQFGTDVLVKGGHLEGDDMTDILCCRDGNMYFFTEKKIETKNTHGTGCTLSSSIATRLAYGDTTAEAVAAAKKYVFRGIAGGKDLNIGHGNGPLWHQV